MKILLQGFSCIYDIILRLTFEKPLHYKKIFKHIGKTTVVRLSTVTIGIILLLYIRWMVMEATKPTFKPTDNPAAFNDNLITRVSCAYIYKGMYTISSKIFCKHQWQNIHIIHLILKKNQLTQKVSLVPIYSLHISNYFFFIL